jgi:broad specificity phosphatase PhoE
MEDQDWHLHSPTPYDSPLSYGGWIQTKALGHRIATLLTLDRYNKPHEPLKPKKIVIQCSPFLRCIQTAIGISAGIGQAVPEYYSPHTTSKTSKHSRKSSRARERLKDLTKSPALDAVAEELTHFQMLEKPILRIDACLGEWLTPNYFDHITPPPDSPFMILSAKAELLTEDDIDPYSSTHTISDSNGSQLDSHDEDIPHIDLSSGRTSLAQALSRHRASSQSRLQNHNHNSAHSHPPPSPSTASAFLHCGGFYHPPVPTYPVAPKEPIPKGYVSHARNACMAVDMQWDSMREPQEWGDGGQLGEEWSSLHRRFRKGLISILNWYSQHTPKIEPPQPETPQPAEDEYDHELVVILVTHSSGANALISALSNQPVLMDIGQASLTVAARRTWAKQTYSNGTFQEEDISINYAVQIRASIEHLRTDAGPSSLTAILNAQARLAARSSGQGSPRAMGYQRAPASYDSSEASRSRDGSKPPQEGSSSKPGLWTSPQIKPRSTSIGVWSKDNSSTSSTLPPAPPPISLPSRGRSPEQADDLPANGGLWARPKRRWTTTESSF